jgi:hypothetical protein
MYIQKPDEIAEHTRPPKKDLSILIAGIVLILVLLLSLSYILRTRTDSDNAVTTQSTTTQPAGTVGSDSLLESEPPTVLDEVPFDSQNPDIERQIQAVEAEVLELELNLLEEELTDSQLGVE